MFASTHLESGLQVLKAIAAPFGAPPGPPGGHQQPGRCKPVKGRLTEVLLALDHLHQERRDAAIYAMTGPAKRIAQAVFRLHPERRQALFYKWLLPGGKLSLARESGP
jgi:hypothetical protein